MIGRGHTRTTTSRSVRGIVGLPRGRVGIVRAYTSKISPIHIDEQLVPLPWSAPHGALYLPKVGTCCLTAAPTRAILILTFVELVVGLLQLVDLPVQRLHILGQLLALLLDDGARLRLFLRLLLRVRQMLSEHCHLRRHNRLHGVKTSA